MSLADWASLALICLLGASSPGPSLIVILSNTRRYGRNAGYLPLSVMGWACLSMRCWPPPR